MRRQLIAAFVLAVGVSGLVGAEKNDPLKGLIEDEKSAVDNWSEESSDFESLPHLLLPAAGQKAVLYSDRIFAHSQLRLCEPLSLDELAELSRGNPSDARTVLNFHIPRVRDLFGEQCLVRINDSFVAVGPGRNQLVFIRDIVVDRVIPVCPSGSPHQLTAELAPLLDQPPLFFSTNLDIPEGENGYRPLSEEDAVRPDPLLTERLRTAVDFFEDYSVLVWDLGLPAVEKLILLKRMRVSLDDVGLPDRIGLVDQNGGLNELIVDRVRKDEPASSIRPVAVLDYNVDGFPDILFEGFDARCSYRYLFEGWVDGFRDRDFPNPDCSC